MGEIAANACSVSRSVGITHCFQSSFVRVPDFRPSKADAPVGRVVDFVPQTRHRHAESPLVKLMLARRQPASDRAGNSRRRGSLAARGHCFRPGGRQIEVASTATLFLNLTLMAAVGTMIVTPDAPLLVASSLLSSRVSSVKNADRPER